MRKWAIILGAILLSISLCSSALAQEAVTDAEEQFRLGEKYRFGASVPQDDSEALDWYRLAAQQGHEESQQALGIIYDQGLGVPQDHTEAAKWFRLAAESSVSEAQYNLGLMYRYGTGVPQDLAEALKSFRLVARRGDTGAYFQLGLMYDRGEGVPQDLAKAVDWFERAAKQGHANAQEMLGHLYSTSRRMRNLPLAHMWLNLAGANGVEEARETRLSLELEMSGNDIGRAQQLARTCHESSYSDCGE